MMRKQGRIPAVDIQWQYRIAGGDDKNKLIICIIMEDGEKLEENRRQIEKFLEYNDLTFEYLKLPCRVFRIVVPKVATLRVK